MSNTPNKALNRQLLKALVSLKGKLENNSKIQYFGIHYVKVKCFGICFLVKRAFIYWPSETTMATPAQLELREIFIQWPKYSGSQYFPVSVNYPEATEHSEAAYYAANKIGTLWDRRTTYGKNRWELLNFCISYLQEELNQ